MIDEFGYNVQCGWVNMYESVWHFVYPQDDR